MPSLTSASLMRSETNEPRSSRPDSARRTNRGKSRRIWAPPTTDPARRLPEKIARHRGQGEHRVLRWHADERDHAGGPRHVERLDHQLGSPDRLEAEVGAPARRERPDLPDDIALGGIHGVRGTDLAGWRVAA